MDSHQDPKYLKAVVELTERAVEDFPTLQDQLDSLKNELLELESKAKKKGKR